MFSLRLYMRNSIDGSPVEYEIVNYYFQDFYIGRRRDPKNLLVIRKFTEGQLLLKDADFDAVSDYFYSAQDGVFYNGTDSYQCTVRFGEPNYTTKQVSLKIDLIDDYSQLIDGVRWSSWNADQQPTIKREYLYNDLNVIQNDDFEQYFCDGSQYMYGAYWGTETETITESLDVYYTDTLLFNFGGEGHDGNSLSIRKFIPEIDHLNEYYKPTFIKWSNSTGLGDNKYFQTVKVEYEREYRYFAEQETPPEGWEPVSGAITSNGFTYNKYARPLYGEQTYLSGEYIYHIQDELTGSDYVTATFAGINTELQKSEKFYQFNDMLYRLIDVCNTGVVTYNSIIADDLYTCVLRNYNGSFGVDKFKLQQFIDIIRDKFSIYFQFESGVWTFKYLDFNTKLLDLNDYRNTDFVPNIQVSLDQNAKEYNFNTQSWQLDFKSQIVAFYGSSKLTESVAYGVTSDLENTSKSQDQFILIKTRENFHDQIYERFTVFGENYGTEALELTPNGKFAVWDTDKLDLSTYIKFTLYSNPLYLDINNEIEVSYGVIIYAGAVRVTVGNYIQVHSASTTVYTTTTSGSSIEYAQVYVDSSGGGNYQGFIYDFKIRIKTLQPEISTGKISGLQLRNGELSAANSIVDNKPLMSYPHGYLANYGTIECNPKYTKDLESVIALDYDLFEYDMNHFCELDSEKYIIFEEKRQVLDQNTLSQYSKIKAKSNEIY